MLTIEEKLRKITLLRIKEKWVAEKSLYEFVKQAWHVLEPDTPFIASWYIQVICEHLEAVTNGTIKRLLINIPPRHTKSLIVSVLWPMWVWIKYPSRKYLCASYSGTLSQQDSINARRLVKSQWYQERWGDRFALAGDQNQQKRFDNDKQGYRIATSVGGTGTGMGGNVLICDDPHSASEAQSDAMRESALQWFDKTWSTRLNIPKKDAMVVIMQRLHEQDVSGHILEDIGGWEHICIPAEYDGIKRKTCLGEYDPRTKKGELICPERFGEKEIISLKKLLGIYGTAGQLQQRPSPAEGGILKTDFIKLWPQDKALPAFEYILQSYDCAFTEKNTGDPTACSVWAVFQNQGERMVMLIDAWDEYLSYPDLRARAIKDWGEEYGGASKKNPYGRARRPDRILVEAKASGQSLIQDLHLAKVPVRGYNPGLADKISRAHQAAPILELGMVWGPESAINPGHPVSWAAEFIKQLGKFPTETHDDYVDTFTQALIYLRDDQWFEMPRAKEYDEPRKAYKERINPYAA